MFTFNLLFSRYRTLVSFSHSPLRRMARDTVPTPPRPLARTQSVPASAGGARSPLRPPHGSGPVSVIVAHMPPVPDAFPARALPRSGSNRCVLRQPSTWRVASGSISLYLPCDIDHLLVARARPSPASPRGVPRVTLRPPSRRPSPRRAQAEASARLTCAASRRRWRRCPAPPCP